MARKKKGKKGGTNNINTNTTTTNGSSNKKFPPNTNRQVATNTAAAAVGSSKVGDEKEDIAAINEEELISAFEQKCSVSPERVGEEPPGQQQQKANDSTTTTAAAAAAAIHMETPKKPASSSNIPSYLRPTASSSEKNKGAKKSPGSSSSVSSSSPRSRSSPASSPSQVAVNGTPATATATTTTTTKSSPKAAEGSSAGKPQKEKGSSDQNVSTRTPPKKKTAGSSPPKTKGSSSPTPSTPAAAKSAFFTKSPSKATGSASPKVALPAATKSPPKTATKMTTPAAVKSPSLKSPPKPAGSCCAGKKENQTDQGGNITTLASTPATTSTPPPTVCCGCGDNCHCCIENGWSYCQCGPSCRCSNPLMVEQASLVLEASNTNNCTMDLEAQATTNTDTNGHGNGRTTKQKRMFVDIVVGGMTCTMCSQALTNALNAMKEVQSVNVSLSTDVAHIEFDLTTPIQQYGTLVEQVQDTIANIGYMVVDVMPMPNINTTSTTTNDTAGLLENSNNSADENPNNNNLSSSQQDRWDRIAQRQEEKLRTRKRAFLWSLVGTLPILLLTMILPHVVPHSNHAAQWWHRQHVHIFRKEIALESLILWLLATPVQFICGWDFYKSSYYGIFRTGTLGMDVLVVLGTTASYGYALYATISDHAEESHFFETSAVLICFVLLGKWMQALAVHRTSDALSHLMQLQPSTAIRVLPLAGVGDTEGGSWDPMQEAYREETVPTSELQRGDIVKIVPGASLPADGVVLAGELAVDESMVTGESLPVLKTNSSVVLGGTVCVESSTAHNMKGENRSGESRAAGQVAFCQVTGVGSSTALAQIIQLVQDAQASKVPMQNFADTVSSIFVPVVATSSIITFLVWYALCSSDVVPEEWYTDLHEDAATFSLMFAIACLVISCPCALGLATPTAVMVGTGMGAKLGILMKGGEALEAASKVNAVILDKTGTLTTGKPAVTDFIPLTKQASSSDGGCCSSKKKKKDAPRSTDGKPLSRETILWLLGSLERSSEHPLAKAIVSYSEMELSKKNKKGPSFLDEKPFLQPTEFRSMTGRGASGYMRTDTKSDDSHPHHVAVGNRAFFSSLENELTPEIDDKMKVLEEQGKTAILAAINNQFCVILGVADELKSDAAAAVAYLRDELKVDVWMVTGDNARTAQAIASQLNLPPHRVISEALPNAKVHQVRKLQQQGLVVAHVGDGINDSPALAQADVGISMGTGAAIAAEASDMVLVRGHYVADVCTALDLCRVIFSRIKWNFMWSLIYNCLGIPLAAGVCFPIFHTRLPPTVAALAMALSSVSVVFSSLALRLYRPPTVAAPDVSTNNTSSEQVAPAASSSPRRLQRVTTLSLEETSANPTADLRQPLLSNDHLVPDETAALASSSMEEGRGAGRPT